MNSLLQTLFMTPEFRAALYQWKFDPSKEADQKEAHGAAPAAAAAAGKVCPSRLMLKLRCSLDLCRKRRRTSQRRILRKLAQFPFSSRSSLPVCS